MFHAYTNTAHEALGKIKIKAYKLALWNIIFFAWLAL
jgi:hypothetical protein